MQDPSEFRQTAKSRDNKMAFQKQHPTQSTGGLADKMGILIPVVQVFILPNSIYIIKTKESERINISHWFHSNQYENLCRCEWKSLYKVTCSRDFLLGNNFHLEVNENSLTDSGDMFTTPVFKSAIFGVLLYLISLLFKAGLSAAQIQEKKK